MRDAERTRRQILDAARRILARDGFAGLGVNALAAEAGVGKPLVYRYFGNMGGVAAALVAALGADASSSIAEHDNSLDALIQYGRGLAGDRTQRDLLAWSLAAGDGPALGAIEDEAPVSGDGPDRAAIMAILQAASAFLLVCRDRHAAWAGMPLTEPRHMARLERALATIVEATLSGAEVTKK